MVIAIKILFEHIKLYLVLKKIIYRLDRRVKTTVLR